MRSASVKLALIGTIAMLLCATPISLELDPWASKDHASLNVIRVDSAQAVVGRPATPGSVAGVARRTTRRAVRRGY
jgi:hypothetical protein